MSCGVGAPTGRGKNRLSQLRNWMLWVNAKAVNRFVYTNFSLAVNASESAEHNNGNIICLRESH